MQKTILVTGGAGFIGSNFVRYLYEKYPDVRIIVLDALTYAGNIENLPVNLEEILNPARRIDFWYGNIRNGELVDTLISQADIVVHFAAETHVTRSIYDNFIFFETDVLGTQTIANSVLKYASRIEKFIHVSTSEVYGTAETPLMNEDHPLMPTSPYAAAKTGADRLVYSYWTTYEIPAVIVRPFNNYGPYQHLEKAIPRFITSCLMNEPIRIHGDGSAARDYIHVHDTCRALDLLLNSPAQQISGQVFNIASGQDHTMLSIARQIIKLMGQDESMIHYVGERPGQVFRHTGDTTRIQRALGWQPEISWESGLEQTIEWYRTHSEWWQKQLWMRSVPIMTKRGQLELH
jgi:dTDP-glucose 4,6-dehydratase